MAVSFVNSTVNSSTGAVSLAINKPTSQEGDMLVAVVVIESASDLINSVPSGWRPLLNTPLSTRTHRQYVYWRYDEGSEPASYTWGFSASTECAGGIGSFRGADIQKAIGNAAAQVNNTSVTANTAPSILTAVANELVIHIGSAMYGATSTPPTGSPTYTERLDRRSGTTSNSIMCAMSSAEYASAGATGTKAATLNNADYNVASHVALIPETDNWTIWIPVRERVGSLWTSPNVAVPSGIDKIYTRLLVDPADFEVDTKSLTISIYVFIESQWQHQMSSVWVGGQPSPKAGFWYAGMNDIGRYAGLLVHAEIIQNGTFRWGLHGVIS